MLVPLDRVVLLVLRTFVFYLFRRLLFYFMGLRIDAWVLFSCLRA